LRGRREHKKEKKRLVEMSQLFLMGTVLEKEKEFEEVLTDKGY